MTPLPSVRTQLGRVLLTGGDATPHPRDACRHPEDVDATLALLPRAAVPPEAWAEAQAVKRWLKGRAG